LRTKYNHVKKSKNKLKIGNLHKRGGYTDLGRLR